MSPPKIERDEEENNLVKVPLTALWAWAFVNHACFYILKLVLVVGAKMKMRYSRTLLVSYADHNFMRTMTDIPLNRVFCLLGRPIRVPPPLYRGHHDPSADAEACQRAYHGGVLNELRSVFNSLPAEFRRHQYRTPAERNAWLERTYRLSLRAELETKMRYFSTILFHSTLSRVLL